LTKSKSQIEFEPLPEDDQKMKKPDITLVKKLDWFPLIDFQNGLIMSIDYFQKLI